MTFGASRLPFSLDPVIAAAKRRMRQRRLLAAALAIAVAAGAAGAFIALRGPNGTAHGGSQTPTQRLVQQLQYPADWNQVSLQCLEGPFFVLELTTANPVPACVMRFPAPQNLSRNGVAAWIAYRATNLPSAHLRVQPGLVGRQWVVCSPKATPGRPLSARIHQPGNFSIFIGAVACGPDYAAGEAAVRRLVASIHPAG